MKQFFSFVRKEFHHIFRDKRTLLILLGMPVIEIILFGFAITTEVKNVKVAVLDPSNDVSTRKIIEKIQASEYFTVGCFLSSPNEIDKVFQEGKADLILTFSPRFDQHLKYSGQAGIQLIADATDPNTATLFTNYARNILFSAEQKLNKEPSRFSGIDTEVKLLYNPRMKSAYNFVPGVMGMILMLICAMMTSISIVREKETGTMEVLLVSPIKPIFIILAKTIPYFVLSCMNLITILILAVYVLEVPLTGSFPGLCIVSMLFIFVALALGLLISTLAQTQVAAMLISGMALMMPVMLLSGMIFPTESMPSVLQGISDIIPAKWYIIAVKKLMIEGLGLSFIRKELLILAVMAFVLITVSLKKFKIRL